MDKQFSTDPKIKLVYLKEQSNLIQSSIAMLEDKIANPAPPLNMKSILESISSIPRIGEYKDGKYHYYSDKEKEEQKRRLSK